MEMVVNGLENVNESPRQKNFPLIDIVTLFEQPSDISEENLYLKARISATYPYINCLSH